MENGGRCAYRATRKPGVCGHRVRDSSRLNILGPILLAECVAMQIGCRLGRDRGGIWWALPVGVVAAVVATAVLSSRISVLLFFVAAFVLSATVVRRAPSNIVVRHCLTFAAAVGLVVATLGLGSQPGW